VTKSVVLFAAAFVLANQADARPIRWNPELREGRVVQLGRIAIGDEGRGRDTDRIDLRDRFECKLTHVKFTATNDDVVLRKVLVVFRNGQRDSVDLNDRDDRRRPGRPTGLYLRAGQSTQWLDIDDVNDGNPNGRCVEAIQVVGVDRDGRNRGRNTPAIVMVDGFLKNQRGNGDRERGRLLGETSLTFFPDKDKIKINECGIGELKIVVKKHDAEVDQIVVRFGNGGTQELNVRENFREGSSSRWIDLNGRRDRCISEIAVKGKSKGFEKARLQIFGR